MCREYVDLIMRSLEKVEEPYFKLTTTYEPLGIVRERVFCYELYHHMRVDFMQSHLNEGLSLNGEIDKQGHHDYEEGDQKNPDFVLHMPGSHDYNTLVVEVKGKLRQGRKNAKTKIMKDFDTLRLFVGKYNYKAGIFILYNHTFDELMDTFGVQISALRHDPTAGSIFILSIKGAGGQCEEHLLAEI
jgi:hypothetical protein